MKKRVLTHIQTVAADKHLLIALAVFLLLCVGLVVLLAVGIHPSERQIAVHYTSFGTTNFYRDKWYYLLSFIGFVAVAAIAHSMIAFRIMQEKGRYLAIAFAWLGVLMLFITLAFLLQLLKIASII